MTSVHSIARLFKVAEAAENRYLEGNDSGRIGSLDTVHIVFRDEESVRIFNKFALLEAQFGQGLAKKIASRLAMLRAATHLGLVDARPPINLKSLPKSANNFTVDIGSNRKLRFAGIIRNDEKITKENMHLIRDIKVFGVE